MQHIKTALAKLTNGKNSPSTPFLARSSVPQTADVCPECAGAGCFRLDVQPGHPQFGKVVPCTNPVHNGERLTRLSRFSGLTETDLGRRLADIAVNDDNLEMLDAAQAVIAEPWGWLYLWGGPGNAKSEVLIAVCNELRIKGQSVLYIKFTKLVEYMREAMGEKKRRHLGQSEERTYTDRFEQILRFSVLAIDELDKARLTEFAEEFRFDFLDDRYRQAVAGQSLTLFGSNTDPATLPEPIWDRIRDGRFRIVHNRQASARPFMKRAADG